MSITKSYNKNNGIYYAYDTRYEWDECILSSKFPKSCNQNSLFLDREFLFIGN